MKRQRWPVLLLSIGIAAGASSAEVADSPIVPLVSLRDSGYFLGDLIEERVDLQLPAGFTLDAASLPAPGRVAPWLEVRSAAAVPGPVPGLASVSVTYQIFAEVEQASRVPIPPFKLRIEAGSEARQVAVPERSFLLSPALPSSLGDEDRELKPSPVPKLLPVRSVLAGLAATVSLALAAAAYLLWAHDRLPFLPRAPGPFARLWRRSRRKRALDASARLTLLREWHAALNETAGETLYASTLTRVFERAPFLLPLQAPIETLFRQSWQAFYGSEPVAAADAPEILELLQQAALRERGVPC